MASQFIKELAFAARAMERFAKASKEAVPITFGVMAGPTGGGAGGAAPAPPAPGPTLYGPNGAPLGGGGSGPTMSTSRGGEGSGSNRLVGASGGDKPEIVLALRWWFKYPWGKPDPNPSVYSASFLAKVLAAYQAWKSSEASRAMGSSGASGEAMVGGGRGGAEITAWRRDNPQAISGLRVNPNAQVRDTADTAGLNLASTVTAGDEAVVGAVNEVSNAVKALTKKIDAGAMGTGIRAQGL